MAHGPDLILAVDGGGTKTLVAVADRDGKVVSFGRHPSLDPFTYCDWPERLREALLPLASVPTRLAYAVIGLPCHGEVPSLSRHQHEVARDLVAGPHLVINDVEAAYDGAFVGEPGVLLLAGTGSMAWAGDGRRTLRCGGWGEGFGDEGSAFAIGRAALTAVSHALDGRSLHQAFAEAMLARLEIGPDGLMGWFYDLPSRRSAVARLAILVDDLAETGDGVASALLEQAADDLAAHAEACARRLNLTQPFAWSHAGSVFRSRSVMGRIAYRLGHAARAPRLPPIGGALLRAARQAGWAVDDSWIKRLGQSLSESQCNARAT